ncbi:MAG: hypothetical protein A2233_01985 [Candidatus Kerfeldbacteria bacterium RIFOXYA2_FULL_38_24]|uniref:RNA polymerase sigma factor n=1 Tax=Candidatus Kerfeldbacteria bacterium RIFOXYB2_FULL_38_14 TaxID=1798547 RepID=A0A1G2BF66_9BACT|nr:MAG: hypothetical protein A2319_04585 [Candidatus Kerfeldbacteria bacterium RIFOXYB2_FULL_38_14]OGY87885.1 MAG: hypothetical protein A2233_01985 [Candidatus Kerfeldbacteria bacterium RIFOXYA2_FULL_38_24]OGY88699.1 MAG: hypothetical protein A2458_03620 [Candidatus Kerfeldbacteria bacterium RIFOXYC2_FULL_38_9]
MSPKVIFGGADNERDVAAVQMSLFDLEQYSLIVERYEQKILNYIRRISGASYEEAEDIAQEIFLKAYVNLRDFDEKKKFSSWLFAIAHNETISYWRKNKKNLTMVDIEEDYLEVLLKKDPDLAEQIDIKQRKTVVQTALKKLNLKYRAILDLRYTQDLSYEEISDIIKKPKNTVGTLINRAKKELKKELSSKPL